MLRKSFSFRGRVNSREYTLKVFIGAMLTLIGTIMCNAHRLIPQVIGAITTLAGFWLIQAQMHKRMHDLGRSAWHLINIFKYSWKDLIGMPGDVGENQYGPDPSQETANSYNNENTVLSSRYARVGYVIGIIIVIVSSMFSAYFLFNGPSQTDNYRNEIDLHWPLITIASVAVAFGIYKAIVFIAIGENPIPSNDKVILTKVEKCYLYSLVILVITILLLLWEFSSVSR